MRTIGFGLFCAAQLVAALSIPIDFEPNRGQAAANIRYIARIRNATVALMDDTLAFDSGVQLHFVGASPGAWTAEEKAPGTTAYHIGRNDPITGVPHFRRIVRANLYPGIDLVFYGKDGEFEYDLLLHPGADPASIRLQVHNATARIGPSGALEVKTATGLISQRPPVIYQERNGRRAGISGAFRSAGPAEFSLSVGEFEPTLPLIVDPVLDAAQLIGGSGENKVFGTAASGLIAGSTTSLDFPSAPFAQHHGTDVFVYSIASDTTTIIGGSGDEIVTCSDGMAVAGYTNSPDLPTSTSYYGGYSLGQLNYGGGDWDGFVITYLGGGVVNVLYFGGSGDDRILSLSQTPGGYGYPEVLIGGSTTSDDLPLVRPFQTQRAGGVDGFVATLDPSGTPVFSSYLGGSGDDRVRAVFSGGPRGAFVTGESTSSGWEPFSSAALSRGGLDAFVLRLDATGSGQTGPVTLSGSRWLGGSGDDTITAAALLADGSLALAGSTTSSDLALLGPPVANAGGRDAFLMSLSPDLKQVLQAKALSGSGDEEVTSIRANALGELLVGGWTASPDFPLVDPLQATYGGGASDGFVSLLDSSWNPIFSTYYGGSGADRITAVSLDDLGHSFFGGYSESADLPVRGSQPLWSSGTPSGFYGSLSAPVIHAGDLTVGKDLAGVLIAKLGDQQNYIGVPVTATSLEPSRVLLGTDADDPGQNSVTSSGFYSPVPTSSPEYGTRGFRVYCLAGSGKSSVRIEAPGYAVRTVAVTCVPAGLSVTAPTFGYPGTYSILLTLGPVEPLTGGIVQAQVPRPGAPVTLSAVSSGPGVAILNSNIVMDNHSASTPIAVMIKADSAIDAVVHFSSPAVLAFLPSADVNVRIATAPPSSSLVLTLPVLAKDFAGAVQIGRNDFAGPASIQVDVTSSDETKVRLYSTTTPSTASIRGAGRTVKLLLRREQANRPAIFAEALVGEGAVSITISSPGYQSVTMPVRFGPAAAAFAVNGFQLFRINVSNDLVLANSSANVPVVFYVNLPSSSSSFQPLRLGPRAPAHSFRVISSNPDVVMPPDQDIKVVPDADVTTLVVKAGQPGSAILTLRPDASGFVTQQGGLKLTVSPPSPAALELQLGIGMQASPQLPVPVGATAFRSSDPARVLLTTNAQVAGAASVPAPTDPTQKTLQVFTQALGSDGDAQIIADTPKGPVTVANIHLRPTGLLWQNSLASVTPGGRQQVIVQPAILDPVSLLPVGPLGQFPFFDATPVGFLSSNPAIATAASVPLFQLAPFTSSVIVTGLARGESSLDIVQPPGFKTPANYRPLSIKCTRPPATLTIPALPFNSQNAIYIQSSGSLSPVTITSKDPSRLLFSLDPLVLGSASVTARASGLNAYSQVYAQAVGPPGDVQIVASTQDADDGVSVATIVPGTAAFSFQQNGQPMRPAEFRSVGITLTGTLRAGVDPLQVTVVSSDPKVVAVQGTAQVNPLTSTGVVTIVGGAAGEATLTIVPPPSFVPKSDSSPYTGNTSTLKVTVALDTISLQDFTLGKDLETSVYFAGMPAVGTQITLTSSDPTRLLLSPDATTPGQSSITLTANMPYNLPPVWAQGLSDSGTAQIRITSPSLNPSTANVTLVPTMFDWSLPSPTIISTNAQTLTPVLRPNVSNSRAQDVRPGAVLQFDIASSNPNVVAVAPSTIQFDNIHHPSLSLMPKGPGTATLTGTSRGGVPSATPLNLIVQTNTGPMSRFNVNGGTGLLGRDLQTSITITSSTNGALPASITVTTSDSSKLLVSTSATQSGSPSLSVSTGGANSITMYVQSLSDSGTAYVTVSAPGYQDGKVSFQCAPTSVTLYRSFGFFSSNLTPLSAPISLAVQFYPQQSNPSQSLRPGAGPLTIPVYSTDPSVGSLSATSVTLAAGESGKNLVFQPKSPGSTLIYLGVPPGFADPGSAREQLVTVIPAQLFLSTSMSVGKDLQQSSTLKLAVPVGDAVDVQVESSDTSKLLLASLDNPVPSRRVSVRFAQNTLESTSFSLIGLDSAGTAALKFSVPGVPNSALTVALHPSGICIDPGSGAFGASTLTTFAVGDTGAAQLRPCELDPATLAPITVAPLRFGYPLVQAKLSLDAPILTLGSSGLYFYGGLAGDAISFTAKAPGQATISVQQPHGFTAPSTRGSLTITVK